MASAHGRSHQRPVGHRHALSLPAWTGVSVQMMYEFKVGPALIMCTSRAISHSTSVARGSSRAHRAMTPPTEGSGSPSSSSSLNDLWEFHELVRMLDEAHPRYSDATHEMSQLECCLDIVRVALKAMERETTALQAVAADAQARILGKGALCLVIQFVVHNL